MPDVQRISEFRLPKNFRGRPDGVVLLWQLVQSLLFGPSPQPMFFWRNFLLRLFGAKIGRGVLIRPTARVTYPWKLEIGDYVWVGDNVELYSLGDIVLKHDSVISQRSYICTGSHDYKDPAFAITAQRIEIGPEAWIATDVFVAPGITIGRGAVIGARSSVFKDVPDYALCCGSPAKIYGRRIGAIPAVDFQ